MNWIEFKNNNGKSIKIDGFIGLEDMISHVNKELGTDWTISDCSDPSIISKINKLLLSNSRANKVLEMSKKSFGHYVVYGNKLLFVRDKAEPVEIAEYHTQYEAIEHCIQHNNYLVGVGCGHEIINHIAVNKLTPEVGND